jgi:hypothetical protein
MKSAFPLAGTAITNAPGKALLPRHAICGLFLHANNLLFEAKRSSLHGDADPRGAPGFQDRDRGLDGVDHLEAVTAARM